MEKGYMFRRNSIVKIIVNISEHNAKFSLVNSLSRNRQKTEMISLSYDVNETITQSQNTYTVTSYGFSQYRSYTDFSIKLNGFIRIFAWDFWLNVRFWFGVNMVIYVITYWNHYGYFTIVFGNGKGFSSEIFCIVFRKNFYNKISTNRSALGQEIFLRPHSTKFIEFEF